MSRLQQIPADLICSVEPGHPRSTKKNMATGAAMPVLNQITNQLLSDDTSMNIGISFQQGP